MSDEDVVEPVEAVATEADVTDPGQAADEDADEMRPSGGGTADTKGNGSAG